jgi:hypothetical protein
MNNYGPQWYQEKADRFKEDIEHISAVIENCTDNQDLAKLKDTKRHMVNEMMNYLQGVEVFGGMQS